MNPKSKNAGSTTKSPAILAGRAIRIGAQPIIWSSDDFFDMGGDIPLAQCLSEMHSAGYAGTELGHKFPREVEELKALLNDNELELISGWHSLYLVKNGLGAEWKSFERHLAFLKAMGCSVVIVAECTGEVYTQKGSAIIGPARPSMPGTGWKKLGEDLETLAGIAEDKGLRLVYHHHMGTLVQTFSEIDRLMEATEKVQLLADSGHLAFAGAEPAKVFAQYRDRIGHVHLKDVRTPALKSAYNDALSFEGAVRAGVFTVPGDGRIDFRPLFEELKAAGYEGWMVVEAEQDPDKAAPLRYAKMGREYIRKNAGI